MMEIALSSHYDKDPASSWSMAPSDRNLQAPPPDENVIENLALVDAMDNFRDLIHLFDGHLHKSSLGTAMFAENFERVFDKNNKSLGRSMYHAQKLNTSNHSLYSPKRGRGRGFNANRVTSISLPDNNRHNGDFVELSYEESFKEYLGLFKAGTVADIVEFKAIFKGMVEYTIQAILDDQECVFRSMAMVNPRNGKLVLVERQEAILAPPRAQVVVSGQIPARQHEPRVACNFPSESQLAQHILPLAWGNMLLCEGTDLLPTEQVGTVINLRLTVRPTATTTTDVATGPSPSGRTSPTPSSSVASSSSPPNSPKQRMKNPLRRRQHATTTSGATSSSNNQRRKIDIQNAVDGSPYAGGVWLEEFSPKRSHQHGGFLLHDKHDIPIALCLQDRRQRAQPAKALARALRPGQHNQQKKHQGTTLAYNIMGRNPMHDYDQPTTSQFYPWYRVETNGNSTSKTCTIFIWNGSSYVPLMTTKQPLVTSSWASEMGGPQYGTRILFSSVQDVIHHRRSLAPQFSYGYLTREKQQQQQEASMSSSNSVTDTSNSTSGRSTATCDATHAGNALCDLTIAPGADPALMICLAAVMEELLVG